MKYFTILQLKFQLLLLERYNFYKKVMISEVIASI